MSGEDTESWECPSCTLKNELIVEACAACGATSPLVLQSYAIEEQALAAGEAAAIKGEGRSVRVSSRKAQTTPPLAVTTTRSTRGLKPSANGPKSSPAKTRARGSKRTSTVSDGCIPTLSHK